MKIRKLLLPVIALFGALVNTQATAVAAPDAGSTMVLAGAALASLAFIKFKVFKE